MEQGVGVVVEMEVKAIKLERCCMGTSTPGLVHSIEVVEEYMDEIASWSAGNGTEV